MLSNKILRNILLSLFVVMAIGLIYSPIGQCQNWSALPPYNTLWPLWSPALSPVDAKTGLPTPIVTNLFSGTVLPVQPGLTWDPAMAYPWLLYNTPLGMAYYDPVFGIDLWPPVSLIDPTKGIPLPITLPSGYSALAPTGSAWITSTIPVANQFYTSIYPYIPFLTFPIAPGVTLPPAAFPALPFVTPVAPVLPVPPTPIVPTPPTPIVPVPPTPWPITPLVPTLLTPTAILGL